jgi:hypothetical protein
MFCWLLGITDWGRILPQKVEGKNEKKAYYAARNAIQVFRDVRADLDAVGLLSDRTILSVSRHRGERQDESLSRIYGYETELEQTAAWLAYLLIFNRGQRCTLKQDKVFSVLGITDCFQNSISTLVRLDYSQSPQRVYEITAAQLILHTCFLSVLGHTGDLQIPLAGGLPSWAADYYEDGPSVPLIRVQTIAFLMLFVHAVRSDSHALSKIQNCF